MAGYLRKYVGIYRVKAEYDTSTNDYPRDWSGNIDPSFDDLYIDCRNDIKIKHSSNNVLSCYVPSKQRGTNVLKKIYTDKINDCLPIETNETKKYFNNLCDMLIKFNILVSAEVLDYEVLFEFKTDMLDYIAQLVGAKTSGANISPFSVKNLPKTHYPIPKNDMELYKKAMLKLPKKIVTIKGKPREMTDGLIVNKINDNFNKLLNKEFGKGFNATTEMKSLGLKNKQYYHSIGKWKEYCDFITNYEC